MRARLCKGVGGGGGGVGGLYIKQREMHRNEEMSINLLNDAFVLLLLSAK